MKRILLFISIVLAALMINPSLALMQQQDGRVQPIHSDNVSPEFMRVLAAGLHSNRISTLEGDFYFLDRFSAEYAKNDQQFKLFRMFDKEVPNLVILADVTWEISGRYPSLIDTGCGFVFRNNDDSRLEEPDSFLHAQLVIEGKDFFWGMDKGNFVSYGRQYFRDPSIGRQTNQVAIFANGSDTSVLLNGNELRRNLDVAVTTPGMIHYTVQSGTEEGFGTRCTFENINLFIPRIRETVDNTNSDSQIPWVMVTVDVDGLPKETPTPTSIPQIPTNTPYDPDIGFKPKFPIEIETGPEEEPSKIPSSTEWLPGPSATPDPFMVMIPFMPPVPPQPPAPSATPTPDQPLYQPVSPFPPLPPLPPDPPNGGKNGSDDSQPPQIKLVVTNTPTPTPDPFKIGWINYPPYDSDAKEKNKKNQPGWCNNDMWKNFSELFKDEWDSAGACMIGWSIPGPKPDMPGSYQLCELLEDIASNCLAWKKVPDDFHKFCIDLELQLREKNIPYDFDLNDRKAYDECYQRTGKNPDVRAVLCEIYNHTYQICTAEESYRDSPCRKYLVNPPKNPTEFDKRIMEACQSCVLIPKEFDFITLAKSKNLTQKQGIAMGCFRNTNYLLCNSLGNLYFIPGYNEAKMKELINYCDKYGVRSGEDFKQIQQPMSLPGGPPPDDGTKKRPETPILPRQPEIYNEEEQWPIDDQGATGEQGSSDWDLTFHWYDPIIITDFSRPPTYGIP